MIANFSIINNVSVPKFAYVRTKLWFMEKDKSAEAMWKQNHQIQKYDPVKWKFKYRAQGAGKAGMGCIRYVRPRKCKAQKHISHVEYMRYTRHVGDVRHMKGYEPRKLTHAN